MTLFEQYRPDSNAKLDEEEEEKVNLAAAQVAAQSMPGSRYMWFENGRLVITDPVWRAYLEIAYARAKKDLDEIAYPLISGLDKEFPDVDPLGKYCRVDMGFAQRMERLKNFAIRCPEENQQVLEALIHSDEMKALQDAVQGYCRSIQQTRYAAMVCPEVSGSISAKLEELADRMERDAVQDVPAVQKMDQLLTLMEQVAGIKDGPLNPKAVALYENYVPNLKLTEMIAIGRQNQRTSIEKVEICNVNVALYGDYVSNTGISIGRQVQHIAPKTLEIKPPDASHVLVQEALTDPKNLRKPLNKIKIPDAAKRQKECETRGILAATHNALSALFGFRERMMGKSRTIDTYNRGTLVIVGGKTVSERMYEIYEDYQKSNPNQLVKQLPDDRKNTQSFADWYNENLDTMSAKIVGEALANNEPVAAYVPGLDGKVPKQPTQLNLTDYEVSSDWKSKRKGELDAARGRLETNIRMMEQVRLNALSGFCEELFLAPYFRDNKDGKDGVRIENMNQLKAEVANDSAYRPGRSGMVSTVFCMLAAKGAKIEDILNPTKLQKERADAAQEYINHLKAVTVQQNETEKWLGDANWLGEQIFKGQKALLDQIDQKMKGKGLGELLADDELYPLLSSAAYVLFDTYQEVQRHLGAIAGYIRAAQGVEAANEMKNRALNVGNLFNVLNNANTFRAMMNGRILPKQTGEMTGYLAGKIAENWILQNYTWNQEEPFSKSCPPKVCSQGITIGLKCSKELFSIVQEMWNNWNGQDTKANVSRFEELMKDIKVAVDTEEIMDRQEWWDVDENGKGVCSCQKVKGTQYTASVQTVTNTMQKGTNQSNRLTLSTLFGYL